MMPGETFPLLHAHLCRCTVIQIRYAWLHLRPGLKVPKGNKSVLIDAVLQHAGESAIRHREVCEYLLIKCAKMYIDLMTCAYPKPKTKNDSITAFIYKDRGHRLHQSPSASTQLVVMPTHTDADYQIVAYDAVKEKKNLFKHLRHKLAKRLKRRTLVACLREVIARNPWECTIRSLKNEVARRCVYSLENRANYVLFMQCLNKELIKHRKKTRRRHKTGVMIHFGEVPHHLQEKAMMWSNDDWPWKHSLMSTPCVKRHNTKRANTTSFGRG